MSPIRLAGFAIVVMENHDHVRAALGGFLSRMGAKPVLVATDRDGMAAINQCLPDLILTDIQVFELGGAQLLHKIRILKNEERRFVPVVAMTPIISKREIDYMRKIGFSACLQKPFSPKLLTETILNVTHR